MVFPIMGKKGLSYATNYYNTYYNTKWYTVVLIHVNVFRWTKDKLSRMALTCNAYIRLARGIEKQTLKELIDYENHFLIQYCSTEIELRSSQIHLRWSCKTITTPHSLNIFWILNWFILASLQGTCTCNYLKYLVFFLSPECWWPPCVPFRLGQNSVHFTDQYNDKETLGGFIL